VVTAGIEEGRLIVGVSGGVWATRLRYRAKALRERVAGALGQEIHSVRIKVVQSPPPDTASQH
jgi:predicted nucleic acid-binding Zn ribbon protein